MSQKYTWQHRMARGGGGGGGGGGVVIEKNDQQGDLTRIKRPS